MSIEDKASFLTEFEKALVLEIRVSEVPKVIMTLEKQFTNYDLVKLNQEAASTEFLTAYISALQVQGRSQKTIDRYHYIIIKMITAINIPIPSITTYHLRSYLAREKERGVSDRTLEGYRQVFSAFFNWLQREHLIGQNPCANLGAIKYQKKQRDIYTEVDFEMLKEHCRTIRDKAILCFLQSTGCRISEMTQLNRTDVDFVSLECKVLGKGNKERYVYLDAVAGMMLQMYMDKRTDTEPALFISRCGKRISPHGVYEMLVNLGKEAGVEHVHPHKFRRTTATNLIRHGMPIQEVAAILGHDKLDTTMQYVVLDKSDLKYSFNKFS